MALTPSQQDLVNRTLRKVDALDTPGNAIVGSVEDVYDQLIEASRLLLLDARLPARVLHEVVSTDANASTNATATATKVIVPIKDDFLRLFALKIAGWTYSVRSEDVIDDERDDRIERVSAGNQTAVVDSPIAVYEYLASPPTGYKNTAIVCYPGTGEATPVTTMQYIPETAPTALSTALQELVTWKAAALVFQPIDPQIASLAESRYENLLSALLEPGRNKATRPFRYL